LSERSSPDANNIGNDQLSIGVKFARRRPAIESAGAFVFPLAFRQQRAAMAAAARNFGRWAVGRAARLIAREINDIISRCYYFFNHCFLTT
jgi:hypothetical protein